MGGRALMDTASASVPVWLRSRVVVAVPAVGLAASYLLSWRLWQPRFYPPNLPGLDGLSSISFGVPLVVAALLTLAFPRFGAALHGGLWVLAVLGDQMRIQPVFFSLSILLLAVTFAPQGLAIARWHLIALWGWAGLHKILSGGWPTSTAVFIAEQMGSEGLRLPVAWVVPLMEVGLAGLGVWRRSWPFLRVAGPLFHVGIVVLLLVADWNTGVWPWNLSLAALVPLLFRAAPGEEPAPAGRRPRATTAAALVFCLSPVGFYFGLTDAYLSHNLYTSNVAAASVCSPAAFGAICDPNPFPTFETLNLPMPPEKRLFVAWFNQTCQPGQRLRLEGIWVRFAERSLEYKPCPRQLSQ